MIKPKTPEEVIAFIGSNYNSMIPTADPVMNESGEWVTGELLPLEDIVYNLTVHDLLSAFSEWADNDVLRIEPNGSLSGGIVPPDDISPSDWVRNQARQDERIIDTRGLDALIAILK